MIWRPYPLMKPKKAGWYQCTTKFDEYEACVIDLYFDTIDGGKWIDQKRQSVFDGYKCYKAGREPLNYNRVYTDRLCERVDVIAWRNLPKPYGRWRKNTNKE